MPQDIASYESVFNDIKLVLEQGRQRAAAHVNREMLLTYWNIGRIIVEHEQINPDRAEYGTATLKRLSRELTEAYGRGFSRSNLQNMRLLYLDYPICQTLSGKLSWSHYCELLIISNLDKRRFYECETIAAGWSVRELKRQISTSLYERLPLSSRTANTQDNLNPAPGKTHALQPAEIIKDPYVFEFLGIPDDVSLPESELERALVIHIEKFLLELGQGFMFVGTQQRITLNNTHYYVDMVFYNKLLRAYVLIELKTSKLLPEAVGQINMYLNYYLHEMNDDFDNLPIGIILCTDKDAVTAEYALGGLQNTIFASRYVSHVPDKEQLVQQVQNVLLNWEQPESV